MGETPETLWTAWRTARDATAFETLVRPHLRFAFDLARRSGCSATDAEDVVQESLVVLAREKGDGPARAGVRAWLGHVVRVQAHTQRRSSARRARRERASGIVMRGAGGDAIEVKEQVEAALAHLDPDEREAVVLRYLHDLDYNEIAFVLKASENACRIRVHRALERLRSTLGGGAAALIAAIGLPAVKAEAAMVKGAVAGAGAAPVATGGLVLMTTAAKVVAAAVVASAATAVVIFGAGLGRRDRVPARASATAEPPRAEAEETGAGRLGATPDEMEFLRTALAKERARRVDARIRPEDTGLDILRRVIEGGADATDLLWDYDAARSHVRPRPGPVARIEATGDVTPVDLSTAAADAAVIEFGPGTFRLERSRWHDVRDDLESLEVRGAGMDRTTLVSAGGRFLILTANIVHLRVADLTFDGGAREDLLLDVRCQAAAAFENVRFLRWHAGGGYGAPVGNSGGTFLLFRGCEFLGGFGDSGAGIALAIRGDTVAAFDRCLFADLRPVLMGWSGAASRSVVQVDECTFENSALADSRFLYRDGPEFVIRVRGGQVHFGAADLSDDERRKEWGVEYAAGVTQTQFSAEVPRCTMRDLVRVLELYRSADGSLVGGIHATTLHRGGADLFWLMLVTPDGATASPILVQLRDGRLEEVPPGPRGQPGGNDPLLVTRCRPLAELLRASGLPLDTGCAQADYAQRELRPVVYVGDSWPPRIILDGQTGERLTP